MTTPKLPTSRSTQGGATRAFLGAVGMDWWKSLDPEQAAIIELGLSAIEGSP